MNDAPPPTTTRRDLLAGMALIAGASALPARAEQSQAMNVVLLGDSIFDNKAYVGGGPDVIAQLGAMLQAGSTATLAARDGSTTNDIAGQLETVPKTATHLVISVGGNNALGGEGADRGKGAVGRRSARQACQDQGRFPQELCGDARRRAGTETADRNLHHLRGALRGPHHAGDRRDRLERVQRRDPARGVRARAAGDRPAADHQRRCRLRQRHRAFGRQAGRRSRERSPRSSPRRTSSNRAL